MSDSNQPGANMPYEKVESKKPKKGVLPGIWSAKDGAGPAKWRTDNSGIRGQVRRKGERDPKNGGLRMKRSVAESPKYRDAPGLPPLSAESKARLEKAKAAKAERERKKAKAAKAGSKKKTKKDEGCEVM